MINIPIELFGGFIGMSLFLVIVGFLVNPKMPILIMIAGLFVFVQVAIVSQITMSYGFGELEPTVDIAYQVLTTTATQVLRQDSFNTHAEFVSTSSSQLANKESNCMTQLMAKSGSPDFNTPIIFGVFDGLDVIKYEYGRMNVTQLTTSTQFFKLCNDNQDYMIVSGDRVGVRWNDGNSTNFLTIRIDQANPYDSTVSYQQAYNPTTMVWTSFTANDITMTISLESGEAIQEVTPAIFEFTELAKVLYGLYGATLMLIGLIVLSREK